MKLKKRTKNRQKLYKLFMMYNFDGKNPFNRIEEVYRFEHWKVLVPEWEYDRILSSHFLLVPLEEQRYFVNLSKEAKEEFFKIKSNPTKYCVGLGKIDYFLVNKDKEMTIKCVFHAHFGNRKWWFVPLIEKTFF